MKLTIKKLVLQSLVEKAGTIVSGSCREILPVLKNFYVEASESRLRLVAMDMDLAVIADTQLVHVEEQGAAIIPAKKLADIVKEAGDVDIALVAGLDTATVTTPNTSWSIQLMKDKYPGIPEVSGVIWSRIPADQFAASLKKVRSAISNDLDKRPELTLVKCGPDGIYATDGARLHAASTPVPLYFELPAPAVDDLVRLLRTVTGGDVGVAQSPSHVLFEIGNNIFIATKMQVQFPSVQHIIASKVASTLELQVSREELINAIKRARITADEETNRVVLVLDSHCLEVGTRDKIGNSCVEKLNVHWPHPKFKFSTNWQYLLQAIGDMESPNVRIMLGQDRGKQKAPICIEEQNFYAVINQLRTENE